jgi:sulfur carrier protein ThiS
VSIALAEPVSLHTLVERLGLPAGEIAIAVVNGGAVVLEDAVVAENDRVELFPPIGGGAPRFVDK